MKLKCLFGFAFSILLFLVSPNSYGQKLYEKKINEELDKAKGLTEQGKFDKAKEVLEQTRVTSFYNSYFEGIAKSLYYLGNISMLEKDTAEAYRYYRKAYNIAQITKLPRLQLMILYEIGNIYYSSMIYDQALQEFEKCDSLLYYAHIPKYLIGLNNRLAELYLYFGHYQKAKEYFYELMKYSKQYQDIKKEIVAREGIALCYAKLFDYDDAIQFKLSLIPIYKNLNNNKAISKTYYDVANYYHSSNQDQKANDFYYLVLHSEGLTDSLKVETMLRQSKHQLTQINNNNREKVLSKLNATIEFAEKVGMENEKVEAMNMLAMYYFTNDKIKLAQSQIDKIIPQLTDKIHPEIKLMVYNLAVRINLKKNDYAKAYEYEQKSYEEYKNLSKLKEDHLRKEQEYKDKKSLKERELQLSIHADQMKELDGELIKQQNIALKNQNEAQKNRIALLQSEYQRKLIMREHETQQMEQNLKNKELEKQVEYAKGMKYKASLILKNDSIQKLKFEKKILAEKQKAEMLQRERNNLLKFVLIAIGFFIVLIFFYISVHRANKKLALKNQIIEQEKRHTDEALEQLKQTQAQLVESERLASLGELTAGIAHEIRNPLNFVNNFSELNLDLSEELRESLQEHIKDEEVLEDLMELANMISGNSEKINEHGKRAARIIKQMLDSSRKGDMHFEDTDINLLVEESTKLAYQGVRGKEVDFTVDLIFDFDKKIGTQKVVNQELGRVLINLVTNACHAMLEKMETQKDFMPVLKVITRDLQDAFEIIVEDNGNGISDEVKAKVFDPFFTTKPKGIGTGLGLTMSFDIVKNMHKGSIEVDSKLGEYTRFILKIPKNLA